MLDLRFDESGGNEFSLILFSFSKECLTGNHHRSMHIGGNLHRDLSGNSGQSWCWLVLGNSRLGPSGYRSQWTPAWVLVAPCEPKSAKVHTGTEAPMVILEAPPTTVNEKHNRHPSEAYLSPMDLSCKSPK